MPNTHSYAFDQICGGITIVGSVRDVGGKRAGSPLLFFDFCKEILVRSPSTLRLEGCEQFVFDCIVVTLKWIIIVSHIREHEARRIYSNRSYLVMK